MKNATPRTLENLHNRETRHEVAISTNGGTFIANYMVCKSRNALLAVARDNSEFLLAALGTGDDTVSYSTARGLSFGPSVRIYYTGRTERDARIEMGN